jgi:hypothetical protein
MCYILALSLVIRYPKSVVREIVLRDHLLEKANLFFNILFLPPQHLSYMSLLRYHRCTCPKAQQRLEAQPGRQSNIFPKKPSMAVKSLKMRDNLKAIKR